MNCFLFFSYEIIIYSLYLYELFLKFFLYEILKSQIFFKKIYMVEPGQPV